GGRIEAAHMAYQLRVVGADEKRIRHAQDDDLGLADAGMNQRVDMADVAIDHMNAPLSQGPEDERVEVDDADLLQQRLVLPLDLAQQRAGRPKEAEDNDPPGLAVPGLAALVLRLMDMVEVA